jgi:hypothetical protein
MPCPDKKPVRSYLTAQEHDHLVQMADLAGLTISQFIRKTCLGQQVKTFEHRQFRLELLKTRSDLGRMGGLLKAGLLDRDARADIDPDKLKKLLADISLCQQSLKEAVDRL